MCKYIIAAGLGFGDEGKGSMVDFLCRKYRAAAVVRYNGGPQAAHHVVLPDGRYHCFSQFGSGTFVSGARTHLSKQMLVKPTNLLVERDMLIAKCQLDALSRLTFDPRCALVTPWHGLICQLEEIERGTKRHGSVGMGVGQAVRDRDNDPNALVLGDLLNPPLLRKKFSIHLENKLARAKEIAARAGTEGESLMAAHRKDTPPAKILEFYKAFGRRYAGNYLEDETFLRQMKNNGQPVVLEGAQGMLLDVNHGFLPYITKTDVTFNAATALLTSNGISETDITRVGILRAYTTRHGAGPFVTEDRALAGYLVEPHNATNPWQGEFRAGWFDMVMARYALEVCGGVDSLAITCLDRLSGLPCVKACVAYEFVGSPSAIDGYFDYEMAAGKAYIYGIRPQATRARRERLAELLFFCRPARFEEFSGWTQRSLQDKRLPAELENFVKFLESSKGLSKPIAYLSLGPTAADKRDYCSGLIPQSVGPERRLSINLSCPDLPDRTDALKTCRIP